VRTRFSAELVAVEMINKVTDAIRELQEAERRSRRRGFLNKVRSHSRISRTPGEATGV
jgi:hypothetical protein